MYLEMTMLLTYMYMYSKICVLHYPFVLFTSVSTVCMAVTVELLFNNICFIVNNGFGTYI